MLKMNIWMLYLYWQLSCAYWRVSVCCVYSTVAVCRLSVCCVITPDPCSLSLFRGKQEQRQTASHCSDHLLRRSDKVTVRLMTLTAGCSVKHCHVLLFLLKQRSLT